MLSLSCIAASICFTAAVIAAREGRYDAALVLFVCFAVNTVVVCLAERRIRKLDISRRLATSELCNEIASLLKELYQQQKKGENDDVQSGEQEAD